MREERKLVSRLDLADGARQGFVDISDILRNRARIERRLLQLNRYLFCTLSGTGIRAASAASSLYVKRRAVGA